VIQHGRDGHLGPYVAAPIDPRALGAAAPLFEPTTAGTHILRRFAQAFAYLGGA